MRYIFDIEAESSFFFGSSRLSFDGTPFEPTDQIKKAFELCVLVLSRSGTHLDRLC